MSDEQKYKGNATLIPPEEMVEIPIVGTINVDKGGFTPAPGFTEEMAFGRVPRINNEGK